MDQDRLSSLAMLSIEKNTIMNIADFNNKVIDVFAGSKDFTRLYIKQINKNLND